MRSVKLGVAGIAALVVVAITASAPGQAMPLGSGISAGAGDQGLIESLVIEVKGGRGGRKGGKRGKRDNDVIDIDIGGGKGGLLGGGLLGGGKGGGLLGGIL